MSDLIDIGPECFAASDGSVLSWRGQNYVPQPPLLDHDVIRGFLDVNDFKSTVVYGIFNDPDAPDILALPEHLRPQLTDIPLYEDESETRTFNHAKLMNDDRSLMTPPRSPAIVKRMIYMKTPWEKIEISGVG